MTRVRFVVSALLLGATLFGCGSKGTLNGKILLDGAPLADQDVLLQTGAAPTTARTDSAGAYVFKDVPTGTSLVSVDVPSSLEGHQQVVVDVTGSTTVPDLAFNGVGTLNGTVTDPSGAPLSGATVYLLGTQLSASTDAQGTFTFTRAPTGEHTVSVTTSDGHAEASVTLARGETQQVALALVANPPGTLTGQVTYSSATDASSITVSVPAANVTTKAALDGTFSLSVPAGTWDVFASAAYFPTQKIGTFTVGSGETTAVPPALLSIYVDLPDFGMSGALWELASNDTYSLFSRSAVLLAHEAPGGPPAFYAYDVHTRAVRLVSVGNRPWLSHDGTHAILEEPGSALLVEDLSAGTQFVVPMATSGVQDVTFADDNSGARVRVGSTSPFHEIVVSFSDHLTTDVTGYSRNPFVTDDLVQTSASAPLNWVLVTPKGVKNLFNDATVVRSETNELDQAVAAAVLNCASAPCPVQVYGAHQAQPQLAQGVTSSGTLTLLHVSGNWADVHTDTGVWVVNLTDGTATALPSGAGNITFSPDGTRVAFTVSSGNALVEVPLPIPNVPLTPVVTSAGPLTGTYVTGSRWVGFDNTPVSGAAYRFELNAGVLTKDGQYMASTGNVQNGTAIWKASSASFHFTAGSAAVYSAPPGVESMSSLASELILQPGPLGTTLTYGSHFAVSYDGVNTLLFNGSGDEAPRVLPHFVPAGGFLYPALLGNVDTQVLLADFETLQTFPLIEPRLVNDIQLDESLSDKSVVLLCPRLENGQPTGGAIAVVPILVM